MKYLIATYRFFGEYWAEISHAARLTLTLWGEIVKLAPKLAAKWREAAKED